MPGSADQIVSFLKMKLEQRTRNLREAFRKLDKSNTGFLSIEDFEGCLRDFNLRLTRSALAAVVAKYDVNNDGRISREELKYALNRRLASFGRAGRMTAEELDQLVAQYAGTSTI